MNPTAAPSATALPSATPVALVLVPDLTSRTLADARNAIQPLHLQIVAARQEYDLNHPVDTIITQDPAPGTPISPGEIINVVISKGSAQIEMPGVVNTDGRQAQQFLAGAAFHFNVTVQSEPSSQVPTDVVTRQEPGAGQPVLLGASVTIWISTGPQVVPTTPSKVGAIGRKTVVLHDGESLQAVALVQDVSLGALLAYNDIRNVRDVDANATLKIPPADYKPSELRYTFRAGDNLTNIARLFGTSIEAIAGRNRISNPSAVYAEQALIIPLP